MHLKFDISTAERYKSPSQKIKALTESWVKKQIFCPNCGQLNLVKYKENKPVADFFCPDCNEEFELKSKQGRMGSKIVDGAYSTMNDREAERKE